MLAKDSDKKTEWRIKMIQIICKSESYTYNAYHILKAFYPSQEVSCKTDEEASNYNGTITGWSGNFCRNGESANGEKAADRPESV